MNGQRKIASLIRPIFKMDNDSEDEPPLFISKELELRVKSLSVQTISAIQTPRTQIVAVRQRATIQDAISIVNESGFSKLPVIQESKDDIIGFVYAKDLLKAVPANLSASISSIIHPAHFVTFSLTISQLVEFFVKNQTTIAFVIDEFGGVDGLVTLSDVNWQIFGKIKDKFDFKDDPKIVLKDNKIIVDGNYGMDDFTRLYQTKDVDPDGNETLGGFICHLTGGIPEKNSQVKFGDFVFKILEADQKSIGKIAIERISPIAES